LIGKAIVWFLNRKRPIKREGHATMADDMRIGLTPLLRKARMEYDAIYRKEGVRVLSQEPMEVEVEEHVGAGHRARGLSDGTYRQRLP
jgi:hypothetical protein